MVEVSQRLKVQDQQTGALNQYKIAMHERAVSETLCQSNQSKTQAGNMTALFVS